MLDSLNVEEQQLHYFKESLAALDTPLSKLQFLSGELIERGYEMVEMWYPPGKKIDSELTAFVRAFEAEGKDYCARFLYKEYFKIKHSLDLAESYPGKLELKAGEKLAVENKTDFAELIRALFLSKAITFRNKPVELKRLEASFSIIFDLNYPNLSKTITEAYRRYKRKDDSKLFVKRLNEIVVKDIEEKNSK